MKVKAVNRKVEKALGVKVNHPPDRYSNYWVEYDDRILSWSANGIGGEDAEATGYHIRRVGDESDPQTDYFAGFFVKNPTQMIHTVKPPAPKFKVGALIRFKDNKRSQRWGVEGKLGIVTEANGGGMCSVRLNDGSVANYGLSNYYERDMELAKSKL